MDCLSDLKIVGLDRCSILFQILDGAAPGSIEDVVHCVCGWRATDLPMVARFLSRGPGDPRIRMKRLEICGPLTPETLRNESIRSKGDTYGVCRAYLWKLVKFVIREFRAHLERITFAASFFECGDENARYADLRYIFASGLLANIAVAIVTGPSASADNLLHLTRACIKGRISEATLVVDQTIFRGLPKDFFDALALKAPPPLKKRLDARVINIALSPGSEAHPIKCLEGTKFPDENAIREILRTDGGYTHATAIALSNAFFEPKMYSVAHKYIRGGEVVRRMVVMYDEQGGKGPLHPDVTRNMQSLSVVDCAIKSIIVSGPLFAIPGLVHSLQTFRLRFRMGIPLERAVNVCRLFRTLPSAVGLRRLVINSSSATLMGRELCEFIASDPSNVEYVCLKIGQLDIRTLSYKTETDREAALCLFQNRSLKGITTTLKTQGFSDTPDTSNFNECVHQQNFAMLLRYTALKNSLDPFRILDFWKESDRILKERLMVLIHTDFKSSESFEASLRGIESCLGRGWRLQGHGRECEELSTLYVLIRNMVIKPLAW